jgi:acyl carrier protein
MPDDIKKFLLRLIQKSGNLPGGVNVDTFNYVDTGYVDSVGLIKFIVELEQEFGVEFTEDEIASPAFKTVGGVAALIAAKRSSPPSHD